MVGSGKWHAEQAWLGRRAENVLIEVAGGRIKALEENTFAPADAVALKGWTIPGLANVHSHAFQRLLRGEVESGAGDFWAWRFHYLHGHGNELGEALIDAAREEGIRITLIDACYLRGGLDSRPLDAEQMSFSDGDADSWARRLDELSDADGVRIAAAIHSVRAVDPESMRIVATYARERKVPLHIHLAEQPAEVEECMEIEGCTPTELLEREGILGPDLTAVHAIRVDERAVGLLGQNQVSICACATTERDLGDRVGPLRALASAGCALNVGSDSNAVIDILEETRAMELDQRRALGRRVLHQPEDLLRVATVAGMRSLGWDAGELKVGMLADFITLDQPRGQWRELNPAYLIYGFSGDDVTNVVVGGNTVVSR
ncbi:MAG: hypothetical protein AUI15_13450 [Actinobacteria bacterium 13_2_20CM_2_66_6]|nr:MAG: hypothetical protein AUI15_13450 [Actinobacteria bacterium 13_2_20CM_2_66_6]